MNMIERVARQIYIDRLEPDIAERWEDLSVNWKREYWCIAANAIAAMREPTDEMIKLGDKSGGGAGMDKSFPCTENVWRAMIDAALTEGKK